MCSGVCSLLKSTYLHTFWTLQEKNPPMIFAEKLHGFVGLFVCLFTVRCLPIWRKSFVMNGLSCLGNAQNRTVEPGELRLNHARHEFLKHSMLEWCELEVTCHDFYWGMWGQAQIWQQKFKAPTLCDENGVFARRLCFFSACFLVDFLLGVCCGVKK